MVKGSGGSGEKVGGEEMARWMVGYGRTRSDWFCDTEADMT